MTASTTTTEKVPKDCTACRLTGGVGLVGIGAYLANIAWKNKTTPGKVIISTISLVFVTLGVQLLKSLRKDYITHRMCLCSRDKQG